LSNLESLNAVFIGDGMPQSERLAKLNAVAISQMQILTDDSRIAKLNAKNLTALKRKEGGDDE